MPSRRQVLSWMALSGAGLMLNGCAAPIWRKTTAAELPELVTQADPRYDALRRGYNKRIETFPLAIALCTSTREVAASVRFARRRNLPIAVRSGGHSMEGFSSNNGGLVLNLSRLNHIALRDDHSVRTGPGSTLSQLNDVLLPQGRLLPAGSCGSVGIGGLTLGGGYGFFSRQYGLTCDHLREAIMVDGDGEIRSTHDDPRLLWALRGGGAGNFGIVTDMIFDTHAAPPTLHSHRIRIKNLRATTAKLWLQHWFDFSAQLPNTAFSAFVLNGSTLTVLVTDTAESSEDMDFLLNYFSAGADKFVAEVPMPLAVGLKKHYGLRYPPFFKNASAGFYRNFSEIEAMIKPVLARVIDTPGLIYQVNTLGGEIASPARVETASYAHREYGYLSELQAYWQKPEQQDVLLAASRDIQQQFFDAGITAHYVNYCNADLEQWARAYYGRNYFRLQEIKRKYDPENRIRHPQSIAI